MNIAILLAAGSSQRAKQDKLWAKAHGLPLWTLSYKTFAQHPEISKIILVVPKGQELRFLPWLDSEKSQVTTGGETRMESFKKGLALAACTESDIVLDHNAANPYVTAREISEVIQAAQKHGAAAVSLPTVDTLLRAESGFYTENISRETARSMQTPQAVRGAFLMGRDLPENTDLSSALLGITKIALVEADPANKKITTAADVDAMTAEAFLGEDSHAFDSTGTLVLGGHPIPGCPALQANSDGDLILHAIGRALAQAKNRSFSAHADLLWMEGEENSAAYLEDLLKELQITRVGLVIEGTRPRIDEHAEAIKKSLAEKLGLRAEQIHLAAHTGEGLTAFGRGEGLRCLALVTARFFNPS